MLLIEADNAVDVGNGDPQDPCGLEDLPPPPQNRQDLVVCEMLQDVAGVDLLGGAPRESTEYANVVDDVRGGRVQGIDIAEPGEFHLPAPQV